MRTVLVAAMLMGAMPMAAMPSVGGARVRGNTNRAQGAGENDGSNEGLSYKTSTQSSVSQ